MWLIVGLGNPGRKYARTRHNVGFMVLEEFADSYNIALIEKKGRCRIGRGSVEGHVVLLAEPLLYMNMSGPVVQDICRKSGIQPENLVVIHDDLDMEPGRIRIRKAGSSGGHKGIDSIIQSVGSRDFIRVKLGIGREPGILAEDYVLSKFTRMEMNLMKDAIQRAIYAVSAVVSEGVDKAMNRFN
ncbi:MAG: peptidyl-tRNA hydrolase [Nitrospirae bacterium]|nr:peptidyl-tRNA hydrolase [Nitrospirota bacterium]